MTLLLRSFIDHILLDLSFGNSMDWALVNKALFFGGKKRNYVLCVFLASDLSPLRCFFTCFVN